jgi:hypothetical protein
MMSKFGEGSSILSAASIEADPNAVNDSCNDDSSETTKTAIARVEEILKSEDKIFDSIANFCTNIHPLLEIIEKKLVEL